jgi:hypothetical protein
MKRVRVTDTTITSLHPELIKLIFECLLEWPEEAQDTHYSEAAWHLFNISLVSRQWYHTMQETLREEYLNIDCREHDDIVKMYYDSDWLVRQVAPLVTHFHPWSDSTIHDSTLALLTQCSHMDLIFPPVNISNQGLKHLTNLTHLAIGIRENLSNITWSILENLANLTYLRVHFRDPIPFQVFPSMTSLTELSIRGDNELLYSMDFRHLSRLTNITTLEIGDTKYCNFFTSLTALTTLILRGPMFPAYKRFRMIPQLRLLGMRSMYMDCKNLVCLTNLHILVLSRPGIASPILDFHMLGVLTSLQCLVISDRIGDNTRAISLLTSLTFLDIERCHSILPFHLSPLVNLRYFTQTQCRGLESYSSHLPSLTNHERDDLFQSIVKK